MSGAMYPVSAYPPLIAEALIGLSHEVQAPAELTALSFLAAASAATQGVFDVRLPTGSVVPTSLFTIAIAESGDRKTTLANKVWAAHYAHDAVSEQLQKASLRAWKAKHAAWKAKAKSLERAIARAAVDEEGQ